jgi:hypothetical protein
MVDAKKNPFTRVMFHVTHGDNVESIFNVGLSPDFSQGKRKAVWFVPKNGIQSGILHACARHHWRVEDCHVVVILVESDHIRYSGNGMLFYSEHTAIAQSHAPATHFLDESFEGE